YAVDEADFVMIMFNVNHFELFRENYGHEWTVHLLRHIAHIMQDIVGVKGIAGRLYTDHFMIVRQFKKEEEIKEIIGEIEDQVEAITEIDGAICSIYLNRSYTIFSNAKDLQVMYEETEKGLKAKGH
nr:diguanylate cyclase [Lachnospiraceae bacterium]